MPAKAQATADISTQHQDFHGIGLNGDRDGVVCDKFTERAGAPYGGVDTRVACVPGPVQRMIEDRSGVGNVPVTLLLQWGMVVDIVARSRRFLIGNIVSCRELNNPR